MVGLQPGASHFFYFFIVIFLVIIVGFSVAQLISAAVRTVSMAIAVYMIVLVYSLLLGGFIVPGPSIPSPIRWALRTSYFQYGFEALCINEFQDKSYGQDVLVSLDMQDGNANVDIAALVVIFVGLRTITYFLLRFCNQEKR